MSESSEKLTIGVVSYNSAAYLDPCLRSVFRESSSFDARVVVVDNGSRDRSARIVRERFPSALLIAKERNGGYGEGCNEVFGASRGEDVLLLNADIELGRGCLPPLLRFLAQHPRAGIVGCKLLETDSRVQQSAFAFPTVFSYLLEAFFLSKLVGSGRLRLSVSRGNDPYGEPRGTDVVLGAFFLVRSEVIREIGGMDPRFFMYSEETDYCYRAWKAGWETWYVPIGTAVHHGGRSVEGTETEMFVENHKSKVLYMRIHHGRLRAAGARIALCIGALNRLCLWTLLLFVCKLFRVSGKEKARRRVRMYAAVSAWHLGLRAGGLRLRPGER
jgi:hypothetical protein